MSALARGGGSVMLPLITTWLVLSPVEFFSVCNEGGSEVWRISRGHLCWIELMEWCMNGWDNWGSSLALGDLVSFLILSYVLFHSSRVFGQACICAVTVGMANCRAWCISRLGSQLYLSVWHLFLTYHPYLNHTDRYWSTPAYHY